MSQQDAAATSSAICHKIDAALDFMGDEDQMRPYILHQINEILGGSKRISVGDCATAELTALLAVLLPIFARHLAGIGVPQGLGLKDGNVLTLILGDNGASDTSTGTE